MKKKVELIIAPPEPHWVGDGFRVHNFIPGAYHLEMERMNPFILMDYHSPFLYGPADIPRGVSVHPHRGFETVTIAYQGRVQHHDSSGGGGIIGEGDVQWMTAASGILHKEYHEKEWSKEGGIFQMVQLWVNLPARAKMLPPSYQAIEKKSMGLVNMHDNGGKIRIISGEYKGIKGPTRTFTPIHMMNLEFNAGGQADFSFPASYNTALVVIKGTIVINGLNEAAEDHFVLFENMGEDFSISTSEGAIVLLMSGEPIPEPIAAHGPFVMNTRQELLQAYEDFQRGKFGRLT
jgi:quercetin 2,3-dioxygenase